MNKLFTPSRETKLANLQQKQANAITIFTKTLNDLASVNSTIDSETDEAATQIKELQMFHDNLAKQRLANEKIMGKIKAIIED